jgi:serine/threonine protein kinase
LDISELSFQNVLRIFIDIVTVLEDSLSKLGLIYPDISYDNILFVEDQSQVKRGILIDWESACKTPKVTNGGYKHLYCSLNVCDFTIVRACLIQNNFINRFPGPVTARCHTQ